MCSFLLLFLILIVGFDLLRDSAPHWNAEASSSTPETRGSESLVLAPHWCIDPVSPGPHQIEENSSSTSFQRSTFHQEDGFTNRTARALAMAMRSLPKDQQKDGYEVCSMQCTLDEWNSSQYPTKAVCKPPGRCSTLARLGRMVSGLGRQLGRSKKLGSGRKTDLRRDPTHKQAAEATDQNRIRPKVERTRTKGREKENQERVPARK